MRKHLRLLYWRLHDRIYETTTIDGVDIPDDTRQRLGIIGGWAYERYVCTRNRITGSVTYWGPIPPEHVNCRCWHSIGGNYDH
jgi:hypothetical protein